MKSLGRVQFFATPWTIACQAPPSMGISRQEYWSGLPFPSPGDLPNPGIEPGSPTLQVGSLPSEPPGNGHPVGKEIGGKQAECRGMTGKFWEGCVLKIACDGFTSAHIGSKLKTSNF